MSETFYIHKENKRFVPNGSRGLAHTREVFKNINRQIHLPKPIAASGYIAAIGFTIGLGCLILGLMMLYLSARELNFLFSEPIRDYEGIGLMMFSAISGLIVGAGMGIPYMIRAYLLVEYSDYTDYIYKELQKKGTLLEGEVIDLNKTDDGDFEIKYSFYNPEHILLEGSYVTSSQAKMSPKSKVAVLYLNPYMYILL